MNNFRKTLVWIPPIALAALLLFGSAMAHESQTDYRAGGNHLDVTSNGKLYTCLLDRKIGIAVESFDKSAVMVSERGYVSTAALRRCTSDIPVHVSLIPSGVGVLADINLKKRLYVSVDFVSVKPFTYLATVARLNSSRNMVTLDGAYVSGKKLSELQRYSFGSSGDAGSAVISPDGRYVAPSGKINCGPYGSPGVWDIAKNKRVITDDDSCSALFEVKGNK